MAKSSTKWGILTTGKISNDFTTAIQTLSERDHQVVAVASRDASRAKQFAEKFHIPRAYGSYIELAQDPEIDVVYIGTIHPAHCETTLLMLNNGKNVVCEKPLAMNFKQAKAMLDLAKEKNLFLLEGIWSRFFPVYEQLRKDLEANAYGKVQFLNVNFGFPLWDSPAQVQQNATGGGCLFVFGVYPIQLALLLFGEEPARIEANGILPKGNDVDKFLSVTLHFSGDRIAQLNMHLDAVLTNTAVISCEKGSVEIPEFWAPHKLITPTKVYDFPVPATDKEFILPNSAGFIYEIQGVRESLLKGEKESSLFPHCESIRMVKVMDEIRRKINLVFAADKE